MIRMMGYTKWIAVLFCLLGMTACRQDAPRFRIGVAQCSDDSWRHKMNDEILREAMFYDGVSVEIRSAADDNRKQAEDVHYFIDEGVDLLIISANEAAPMTPIVEEAYQKGIPVILVDRKILSDKYTAYIGADNYEIGRAVGNYIASSLKGKGNVVELTGLGGSTPAMERHQGFMAAISNFPDIKLIDKADAAWEREPAEVEMYSMLRRHPKIDAVYAHNDRIAPGAYQAAKKVGREKEMIFVGIDALPGKGNGLEMVLDSVLNATFIYPTNGDKVMQLAMNILEKKPYPRETVMNTAVVDRTNAHVMQLQTTHISELDQKIETLNGRIGGYLSRVATQQVVMYGGLVILLLVAGLLLVVYKSLRAKNRLNKELSEQKKQLEEQRDKLEEQRDQLEEQRDKLEEQRDQLIQLSHQLEEATHAKLVFFTNISHDFRTPLTLVADPVEHLLADYTLSGDQHRMLMLIQRNVNILLRLVNQILDFRKYENGKMEYTPVQVDVLSSFEGWNESFLAAARKKHIHFSFDNMPDTDYHTLADMEKLERIYFNLLSNAFKYTPADKSITVNMTTKEKTIEIEVADEGIGIAVEKQHSLFQRFESLVKQNILQPSSGIGLSLVKEMVEMHHGTITVDSQPGVGSRFTVSLPLQREVFEEDVQVEFILNDSQSSTPHPVDSMKAPEEMEEKEDLENNSDGFSILVVEDNEELKAFLKNILSENYTVITASNGEEGLQHAVDDLPDLIISDVMMPVMDGLEMIRQIKENNNICHIPIIVLSAKASLDDRIAGLEQGIDDYITKPFSATYLKTRIASLLRQRKALQEIYMNRLMEGKTASSPDLLTPSQPQITPYDEQFMEKVMAYMEEQMDNAELTIDQFAEQLMLSRTIFYRKLKSIVGLTPVDFIREIRIKRAVQLIDSDEYNFSQVAYMTGFNDPKYFSKCFKKVIGITPSEYKERKK